VDQLKGAWQEAFALGRPTVIDVHTDPDVPPIPPHATFDQLKDAAKAMLAGDEDAAGVIRTGIKQKVQEFIPGVKSDA
jgi:pyruvate dehydrogenase (quinone)